MSCLHPISDRGARLLSHSTCFIEAVSASDAKADSDLGAAKVFWHRHAKRYAKTFLIDPADCTKGSWLASRGEGVRLGCKCCRAAGDTGPFRMFL